MAITNDFAVDCDLIICPDGSLGAMDAATRDCNDVTQSQIDSLILWHPTLGTAPTNWGAGILATDFNIDNTDATDVAQKRIFVSGGMPESEEVTVVTNSFQEVTIKRTFTITATLFTFGGDTYDYMRKLQCNKVKPKFVFTTDGGKLFGRDGGIEPSKFALDFVLEEGEESVEKWVITIQYKAKTAPDRLDSPLP